MRLNTPPPIFTKLYRYRHESASDPKKAIKRYGKATGTTVLRKHLADAHINVWVPACDKLNIDIKAKEVDEVIVSYRRQQGQATLQSTSSAGARATFSKEAFVDAITEFIVADDQVSDGLSY